MLVFDTVILLNRKVISFGVGGGVLLSIPAMWDLYETRDSMAFCDRSLRAYHTLRIFLLVCQSKILCDAMWLLVLSCFFPFA